MVGSTYCESCMLWNFEPQIYLSNTHRKKPSTPFLFVILERFQSKALLMIVDALWYVPNTVIRRDLHIQTVKEENRRYNSQYGARLSAHPNDLTVNFIELPLS
jgi:hypothetical protein